jgi:hypothetical protein
MPKEQLTKKDHIIYCDYCPNERNPAIISMEKTCTFRRLKSNKKVYSTLIDKTAYWCKDCYIKYS